MRKHTFFQVLSSVTACLLLFQVGVRSGYVSVIISKLNAGEVPVAMTKDHISWMVALVDIGHLISSFPAGYLMDRFGRLFTLRLAFISYLLSIGLILGAEEPYHMYIAALLSGIGSCIGFSTTGLYIAEIAEPKIRGSLGSIGGFMHSIGTAVTMTFGPYFSFETLTRATLVCPLAGFTLSFFMVESPYYHLIHKDEPAAAKALSRVRSDTKTSEKDVEFALIREKIDNDLSGATNFLELFSQRSNRKAIMIVLTLGMTRAAGGVCISTYARTSLPAYALWDPNKSIMIYSWFNVIFSLLGMSLVDRFGRKPLLIISLLGLGSAMAASAVFYYFYQKTSIDVMHYAFVPHVGVLLFGVFFPIGIGLVSQIYCGELLSVRIKGSASAFVAVITSIPYFIINKIYFAVDQSVGVYFMYVIFSTVNFIGLIFAITCIFETKGKTLEEIQCLLEK